MTTRRAILILNPTSGASALATQHLTTEQYQEQIVRSLAEYDIVTEVRYTTPEDPGRGLAQQAASEGVDLVIAAGGDGTLHAVASGLVRTNSTLGIIPLGTMNNVARSLQIPEDLEAAGRIITEGTTRLIDVGMMNEALFLEVAGIGLEAALFPAAEDIKRYGLWSTIRGVIAGLQILFRFKPETFVVSFDGKRPRRFQAIQISICNSPYYGARLQFAPRAVMDDGFLDVLIYKNFSKLAYLRHAIAISQGRRTLEPRVVRRKVKLLRVRTRQPIEVHTDGTPQGSTPALVQVLSGVLRVCVPQQVAQNSAMMKEKDKQSPLFQRAKKFQYAERGSLHVR